MPLLQLGAYGPYFAIDIEASNQSELILELQHNPSEKAVITSSLIIKNPDTAGKTCSVGYREMLVIG